MRTLAAIFLMATSCGSLAATFNVTRFDDPLPGACLPADCSLREAVNAASATAEADTINLAAGTYRLTRTDPTPDTPETTRGALLINLGDVSIVGAGSALTRVRWDTVVLHSNGVFNVIRTSTQQLEDARFAGMSISHGARGCVNVSSSATVLDEFTLTDVVIENCTGAAALAVGHHNLDMTDSVIHNNTSPGNGGGLALAGPVTVLTSNVRIANNSAQGEGGGVYIAGMVLFVSNVVWVDDGRGVVDGNQAASHGGGIMVGYFSSLQLATMTGAATGQRMAISNNIAGGDGGGLLIRGHAPFVQNNLERMHISNNTAANGGGVAAGLQVTIRDTEISTNAAATGDGGGVWYFADGTTGRALQQVSLRGNLASGGGGAVASDCGDVTVENASFDGNRAASGRGQAIEALGNATLRHVTVNGNGSRFTSPGIRKGYHTACAGKKLRIANSLITENCTATVSGDVLSQGGNQYGVNAVGCPALRTDRRQSDDSVFDLRLGRYGGAFDVWGWSLGLATKPQRNFGLNENCTTIDARGAPRSDGRCDAGAFEQ